MFRLPRLALVSTLVSSLILSLAFAGSVMAGDRSFETTLLPGNEPDGGDTNAGARGSFSMTVDYGHRELCYEMAWENLSANATAAHIHEAVAGVNGPVVIPLSVTNTTTGSIAACITVDRAVLHGLLKDPAEYYVNVHTSINPGGAIRGQLG